MTVNEEQYNAVYAEFQSEHDENFRVFKRNALSYIREIKSDVDVRNVFNAVLELRDRYLYLDYLYEEYLDNVAIINGRRTIALSLI